MNPQELPPEGAAGGGLPRAALQPDAIPVTVLPPQAAPSPPSEKPVKHSAFVRCLLWLTKNVVGRFIAFLAGKLRVCMRPLDVTSSMTREVQAEFIRQEHRTVQIILNVLRHYHLPDDDPRRDASLQSVGLRLFTSSGAQGSALVIIGFVGALATLYLTIEANSIAAQQAGIAKQQTEIMTAQTAVADSSINATYGPDVLQIGELIEESGDAISDALSRRVIMLSRLLPVHLDSFEGGASSVVPRYSPERASLLFACIRRRENLVAISDGYRSIMTWADFSKSKQERMDMGLMVLTNARLSGSSFVNANLSGAEFLLATLDGVDFTDSGSNNPDNPRHQAPGVEETSFRSVIAPGVIFNRAHLHKVTFQDAELKEAQFEKTKLIHVKFNNANLRAASFKEAKLMDVSFDSAVLPEATAFKGASLIRVNFEDAWVDDESWLELLKACVSIDSADTSLKGLKLSVAPRGSNKGRYVIGR